ncbi:MAG TPA: outer membrane lipoprotein chaperone LolA [Gemmatimonadales bacterium]|nr:outer membrane lipoprotein chaperone LolA [Gemmatimonadales bacterium]
MKQKKAWGVGSGLFLAVLSTPLAAQDPFAILARARAAFDTIHTLRADFVQIVDNPMVGAPDTTRGVLYQAPPSRFTMNFTHPKGDRILADGKYLWVYTPSTTPGQVIRTALASSRGNGPDLIGQFMDHPEQRFHTRFVRTDSSAAGVADVIHLEPIAADRPYTAADMTISRSGLVTRLDITETSGQKRVLIFSKYQLNVATSGGAFRFTPAAGVRVVDQ